MYLRVKEVRSDGIVVRGAKAHTTQAAVSDEIIVIPTRAMREEERSMPWRLPCQPTPKGSGCT